MDVQQQEIQAMKEIVDVCVGTPLFTYEAQINAQRPSGDYAAIKCISSTNPGFDERREIIENGSLFFLTRGIRILKFHIMFSRDGQEYINFDNSFYRQDVRSKMREHGFAAMGKTSLDLATTQLETNWEIRKAVVMEFNVIREQRSTIGIMTDAIIGSRVI